MEVFLRVTGFVFFAGFVFSLRREESVDPMCLEVFFLAAAFLTTDLLRWRAEKLLLSFQFDIVTDPR